MLGKHCKAVKMRLVITLVLCVTAVFAAPQHPNRIMGGSPTTIEAYPTIAALLYTWNGNTYSQACGGTILTTRAILTAAHCPYGDTFTRWRVRLGSTRANSGGVVYNFASVTIHPNFNPNTMNNDIAIMRTANDINYSNAIQAASIASPNYQLGDQQVVWAAGWGTTSTGSAPSEQLRHVQIYTINQATCRSRYASAGFSITENMLCSGMLDTGGRDQCQGDSGGPLYHNRVVVGVCSFGLGCGRPEYPGVNTRVSRFSSWIQMNA